MNHMIDNDFFDYHNHHFLDNKLDHIFESHFVRYEISFEFLDEIDDC